MAKQKQLSTPVAVIVVVIVVVIIVVAGYLMFLRPKGKTEVMSPQQGMEAAQKAAQQQMEMMQKRKGKMGEQGSGKMGYGKMKGQNP